MDLEHSSWTDDIAKCKRSGIGSCSNEIYRPSVVDGRRSSMHPFEDRSFFFRDEDAGLSFLGVLDGFRDGKVSDFAAKKMPAEVMLGQVTSETSDEAVKAVLRRAFVSLDREYFDTVGEFAARAVFAAGDDDDSHETVTRSGASATVALVVDESRLFVANVGDTEAVLCTSSLTAEGDFSVIKLSIDHVWGKNEDEDLRLRLLGLNFEKEKEGLGDNKYTRCLGHFRVKGGYKEVPELKQAKDSPVICDPEVHGPIAITDDFLFLLIYSRPLKQCLIEVLSCINDEDDVVMKELCIMTLREFEENSSVTGVAQSVVDKVVRMHKEQFFVSGGNRDDISLLVRNFNCGFQGSTKSRTVVARDTFKATRSSTTTENSEILLSKAESLPVDKTGRIIPYVDFSHFNKKWNEHLELK